MGPAGQRLDGVHRERSASGKSERERGPQVRGLLTLLTFFLIPATVAAITVDSVISYHRPKWLTGSANLLISQIGLICLSSRAGCRTDTRRVRATTQRAADVLSLL